MTNPMHEANRRRWDAAAANYAQVQDERGLWRIASERPREMFSELELELLSNVSGKRACVLGSGDNLNAFALAGLGADVTSLDISERQLEVAERRAGELGLEMTFVRADVIDLPLPSDHFDIVYTGGHVAVWVSDLRDYYAEAIRILKRGGLFLVREYHPFRRIWKDDRESLAVDASYFERGPHYYEVPENLFDTGTGDLPCYEFRWTVSDFVRAVIEQGAELITVDEFGDQLDFWEYVPVLGLPEWLLIAARRK